MTRRRFLAATAGALAALPLRQSAGAETSGHAPGAVLLEPFDYTGVTLKPSRWQRQYAEARDFYFEIPNDDILHGFREDAGIAAPGQPLGGWCSHESYEVLGHWLQAMARASRATGDSELRDKAGDLMVEWGKTLELNPDAAGRTCFQRILAGSERGSHYYFDKMAGGLADMHHYAGHPQALPLLEKITSWAKTLLRRDRVAGMAPPQNLPDGFPLEWYTLGENLFRAYEFTGDAQYRDFAEVWLYPDYWNRFLNTSRPANTYGLHAYSHCNTLSSAAMAFRVTGDPQYLRIIRNAYDFFQQTQCYATGGYGPGERILAIDGSLGRSLESNTATFECPCGSWAGFKLSRYLMAFTGEARYGDWMEKLLYNAIGAALPMSGRGRTFYYSDYTLGAPSKQYYDHAFPCCAGTYFQDVTEYHNLIYFKQANALYINLYVPSEVVWNCGGARIKLEQKTNYPDDETITWGMEASEPAEFGLRFRVPGWSYGVSARVNGKPESIGAKPGEWASLTRRWQTGDKVEVKIPLRFVKQPIDQWHPHRVALLRGPVVMVQDLAASDPLAGVSDGGADRSFRAADEPGVFRTQAGANARCEPCSLQRRRARDRWLPIRLKRAEKAAGEIGRGGYCVPSFFSAL